MIIHKTLQVLTTESARYSDKNLNRLFRFSRTSMPHSEKLLSLVLKFSWKENESSILLYKGLYFPVKFAGLSYSYFETGSIIQQLLFLQPFINFW